jgi:hypothetical protein
VRGRATPKVAAPGGTPAALPRYDRVTRDALTPHDDTATNRPTHYMLLLAKPARFLAFF